MRGECSPHPPHVWGEYNHDTGENVQWQCPGVPDPKPREVNLMNRGANVAQSGAGTRPRDWELAELLVVQQNQCRV